MTRLYQPLHRLLVVAAGAAMLGPLAPALADPPPPAPAPAELTRIPKLTQFIEAVVPPAPAGREAVDVLLDIDIDERGQVVKVDVARSAGAALDEAAVDAARRFQFTPGYAGEQAVPVHITYRYHFKAVPPPAPPPPAASEVPPGAAPTPAVETVAFSGSVLKMGDRTIVAGATVEVVLEGGLPPLTVETDAEGKFQIPAVPVGEHKIRAGAPSFAPAEGKSTFRSGRPLREVYYLFEKQRYTSVVRGRRLVKDTVEQTLDVEEIKRIPGTQGDTIKAVQNLPGVARVGFGGGVLPVWGSRPEDTRVYVDDVYVPTLFHFGGVRAVVPTESVQSLTFTPGGYGAEHGWGLGGVVQIDTKKPRSDGYHGFAQIDLVDGGFRIEGPITRKLDFALSARRSWIDVFLPLFTSNNLQLSPKYWDYQAKLHWQASRADELDVLIFGSDDSLSVLTRGANPASTAAFDSHIAFHRGLVRWSHRFDDGGQLTATGALGYDQPFQFGAQVGNSGFNVDVKSCPYSLRATYRKDLAAFVRLDAGIDFEGTRYGTSATSPLSGPPREDAPPGGGFGGAVLTGSENAFTNVTAPWAALNFRFFDKRLGITPGLRVAIHEDDGSFAFTVGGMPPPPKLVPDATGSFRNTFVYVEPRLAIRYQLVPEFAFKGAMGFYTQPPSAQTLFGPFGNVKAKPETALHYVLGFDVTPYSSLTISAEGFYKDLRNIVVGNLNAPSPVLVNEGIGRVYGAEILIRQQVAKGFYGWVSYTLSRSERKDHPSSPDWRVFQYDQTHILTLIASYKFGRGYQIGARFRYTTGNPITPILGGYVNLNRGTYSAINGPLYSGRLAAFQQLDIRFDKQWTFKRASFSFFVDIQNVYNASNAEGSQYSYNFKQSAPVAGIPFFPDIGLRVDF